MKSKNTKLLLINNDTFTEHLFQPMFGPDRYDIQFVDSGEKALSIIRSNVPESVFINHKLPGIDSIEIARRINNMDKSLPIVLMVGFPELDKILPLVGKIIYDYIVKPFKLDQIRIIMERARREFSLKAEIMTLSEKIDELKKENQNLQNMINSIAPAKATVMNSATSTKMQDFSKKRVLHTYQQQSGDNRKEADYKTDKK